MRLPKRTFLTSREIALGTGIVGVVAAGIMYLALYPAPTNSESSDMARPPRGTVDLLRSGWAYMPGVKAQQRGLDITPIDLRIVDKDSITGQSNPPINLYGTHIERAGNFVINATLDGVGDTAELHLYEDVPLIADEFRIEPAGVRLAFSPHHLKAEVWEEGGIAPTDTVSFPFEQQSPIAVEMRQQDDHLTLRVNDKALGTLATSEVFSSGNVWLGFGGKDPWRLEQLTATALHGSRLHVADSSRQETAKNPNGLQHSARKKRFDFLIGAAIALGPSVSDPAYAQAAFGGEFGSLTPENAMKWQALHPSPDTYTFAYADALIDLARRHDMAVHGHTLVFGEANPAWVTSLPTATAAERQRVNQVRRDHIKSVVGHFKGKIVSWDVVNEPLADYDDFDPSSGVVLRNHIWQRAMDESYIADSFRVAHEADPKAILCMNEYGLEESGERWDAFLSLVTKLKKQGVPIHCVGFQSHVYDEDDRIDLVTLRRHMQQLAQIGVKSRISEIDVYAWGGRENQAAQYASVFKACFDEPGCISYTTWGISDRYNRYKDDAGVVQSGEDYLWDAHMQPTLALDRIREFLK